VDVLEKVESKPFAEAFAIGIDGRPVIPPRPVKYVRGRNAEAVASVLDVKCPVQKEDAGRQRVRLVVFVRVEDTCSGRIETTQGRTESVA
jgi:hypothetical protein